MFHNNKELRTSLILLGAAAVCFTVIGFYTSVLTGSLTLALSAAAFAVHMGTEYYRYRRLQMLGYDLDQLLHSGTPLPISQYNEGELSFLANHIEKLTLRLKENAESIQKEKLYLADSLADISHQLRTPLTSMNLTVSLLRNPELSVAQQMALTGELRKLLARTDWLVETLLKLSKLDAGTVTLTEHTVSVRQLIQQAVSPIAIAMDLRNQTLYINCSTESVSCDAVWTAEALGNILKNCMEHTPSGGCITISVSQSPLFTQIAVEDTGSGFDPKDIPHLFERFYKGSNAAENSYGIGLALARTVIAAQNGTVQAMNTENGAKFLIKFYKQVI